MASIQERGQRNGDSSAQVVPGECKKPLDYGLRGEDLASQFRPAERHLNGARAFQASQRAYNGGASVVDRAEIG